MTKRMIHSCFFSSELIADLTICQRLLIIGMIAIADDQGRLKGNARWLRAQIFPYDDITAAAIEEALKAIESSNDTIIIYDNGPYRLIQIVNWWEYQSLQWAKPSQYTAPDGWGDRIRQMVYKPKRWVMTLNWPGSEDNYSTELLGNALGNKIGNALPISNTNTNTKINTITNSSSSLPAKTEKYEHPIQDKYLTLITELSQITKTPYGAGINEDQFQNAALFLDAQGATAEKVAGFAAWWEVNTYYDDNSKASLKSLLECWDSYVNGVVRNADKKEQTEEELLKSYGLA